MSMEKVAQYIGIAYVIASALVAFLTALSAALPGKAGEVCHRAAIVVGKVVAAFGEMKQAKAVAAKDGAS